MSGADSSHPLDAESADDVRKLEADGFTAAVIVVDGTTAGVLGFADRLRPGARDSVARLAALTGPPARAAHRLTTRPRPAAWPEVGIVDAGWAAPVRQGSRRRRVAGRGRAGPRRRRRGDDAPAMANAEFGVAMGGAGSALALQPADAVVVRDVSVDVPAVIALSRRARRLVVQNRALAGTAIAVLITWDLAEYLPLPLGVAGHKCSTILVALNGLRLLRPSTWPSTWRGGQ